MKQQAPMITIVDSLTLFVATIMLAAMPSVSVMTVVARSASAGFYHGFATTCGIVLGDIIYITIALYGISTLIAKHQWSMVMLQLLGGIYMIYISISIYRSNPHPSAEHALQNHTSLWSSLLIGFFITIADQKAILFYLGFFPAFIDLKTITQPTIFIITGITIIAVGGTKLVYAYLASQLGLSINSKLPNTLNRLASLVLMMIGLMLITRAVTMVFD